MSADGAASLPVQGRAGGKRLPQLQERRGKITDSGEKVWTSPSCNARQGMHAAKASELGGLALPHAFIATVPSYFIEQLRFPGEGL